MEKGKAVTILLLLCLCTPVITASIVNASSGSWVELAKLEGYSPKFGKSPLFTCNNVEWRIKWEYVPHVEYPNMTVFGIHVQTHAELEQAPTFVPYLRQTEEEETYSVTVGSVIKSGTEEKTGILYINGVNGTFYMDIVSNADSFTIIVEQNIESIPEFPSWSPLSITLVCTVSVGIILRRNMNKQNLARRNGK